MTSQVPATVALFDSSRTASLHPMKVLLYGVFISALVFDSRELRDLLGPLARPITYVPEALAGLVLIGIVIATASRRRSILVPGKYLLLGLLFLVHIAAGVIYNDVPEGTVFAGIRIYLRYLPLFFVPLVIRLSDDEIWKLMKFVLAIMLIQVPIAFAQRLAFPDAPTGDMVRGTFGSGAIMSIALVASITALFSFYLRSKISVLRFLIVTLVLIAPTMINETKGTIILLPLTLATVAFYSHRGAKRVGRIVAVIGMAGVFLVTFASVYETIYESSRAGRSGFFSYLLDGGVVRTVYRGPESLEEGTPPGRGDAIVIAYQELGDDLGTLVFGLGMGNVSNASGAELLRGEYAAQYQGYGGTTLAVVFWELGSLGIVLALVTLFLLFRDARRLSASEGFNGALGLAWVGIVALVTIALFYKNMLHHASVCYPFMFFSGLVVERLNRRQREVQARIDSPIDGHDRGARGASAFLLPRPSADSPGVNP